MTFYFIFFFPFQERAGSLILCFLSYQVTVSTADNVIIIMMDLCFSLMVHDSFSACW